MKSVIKNYTYNAAGKTVTLTDFTAIRLDRLALITDVTTNQILYSFVDPTISTATVATNVITLSAVPGGTNNADKLRIDYTTMTGDPVDVGQPVINTDAVSGNAAQVSGLGQLSVGMDPITLFSDTFEGGTFDVTNHWNTYGSVAATQTTGAVSINPAATASATVSVASQPSVPMATTAVIATQFTIEPTTTALGNHRFFGLGVVSGNVGTSAAPLTDAVGFEIDTAGAMRASVYNTGVRTFTQLVGTPTDGLAHIFILIIRGDIAFFYKDNTSVPVAFTPIGPASQLLPVRLHSLNSGAVTGTPTFVVNGIVALDQSRAAQGISDGTFPWRKATVSAAGSLSTTVTAALPAGTNTIGALATGANTIGALTANQSVNTAQIGGVAPLMGTGVTGTGAQRVILTSDNLSTVTNLPAAPTAFALNSAATTNATSIKATSGRLFQISCSNQTASAKFVKIYNKASAPTVGTDIPVLTLALPVSGFAVAEFGAVGLLLGTGIALAITGAITDADATAVAVGDVKVSASYI